jgi:hypothetical protein
MVDRNRDVAVRSMKRIDIMTFAACSLSGAPVQVGSRARASRHEPKQTQARRHALWLNAVEVGLFDPVSGRIRPHTTSEIARLFGVGVRAVQLGIASARSLRLAIEGHSG